MATADSVKSKIQGLINRVNDITGASETTLTDAIYNISQYDGTVATATTVGDEEQGYVYFDGDLGEPCFVQDAVVQFKVDNQEFGNATAANVLSGKTFTSAAGYMVAGTMATATQATPTISVSTAGKITASATQTAGYVSAGTKSATRQLTVQAAKTVTPTTSNQTAVASGKYTTGAITVKGDANLVAGNIKSGVSIFGVAGTYTGSGGSSGGSVTTCTVVFATRNHQNRIRIGYTSYSGGSMQALHYTQNSGTSDVTLSNVPCGSAICIWTDPMNAVSGGATSVYTDSNFRVIQAPSASGTYTYSIEDDS